MISLLLLMVFSAAPLCTMEIANHIIPEDTAADSDAPDEKQLSSREAALENPAIFQDSTFCRIPLEIQKIIAFNMINKPSIARWLIQKQLPVTIMHEGLVAGRFDYTGTKFMTSSDKDFTIKLWDAASGSLSHNFEGHSGVVIAAGFNPSGTRLASFSIDGSLKLWDTSAGSVSYSLQIPEQASCPPYFCFTSDGAYFIFVNNGSVSFYESETGRLVCRFECKYVIAFVAFNQVAGAIVTSYSHLLGFDTWDVPSGKHIQSFLGHGGSACSVGFNELGTHVVTVSNNMEEVKVWSASSGLCVGTFAEGGVRIGEQGLFEEGYDFLVPVLEEPSGNFESDDIYTASLNDDASQVIIISFKYGVHVWDVATQQSIRSFGAPQGEERMIHPSFTGTTWAVIPTQPTRRSKKGKVRIWEISTGQLTHCLNYEKEEQEYSTVVLNSTGTLLSIGGGGEAIKIWNLTNPLLPYKDKITLDQALLLTYLFEIDKCKSLYERVDREPILFDFEKFPHLRRAFTTLPDQPRQRLERLVKNLRGSTC